MKAIWNEKIIAESDQTINIEGNAYFPPNSIKKEYFKDSSTNTECHWKGTASYLDIIVEGEINKNAAWYYPEPSALAENIKNYIAFWKGVKVEE